MFDIDATDVPDQQHAEHELWLAMQAAYTDYMNASVAVEIATSNEQGVVDGSRRLEAALEQRTAFENYLEARMQFLEFRYDRDSAGIGRVAAAKNGGDLSAPDEEQVGRRPWTALSISRLSTTAVIVTLLCTTGLSLIYVARAQRQIQDSNKARDDISAHLKQARNDVQVLLRKIDAVNGTRQCLVPEATNTSDPTALSRMLEGKPPGKGNGGPIRVLSMSPEKWNATSISKWRGEVGDHAQNVGGRSYWKFSLKVSKLFQRVGPLNLSVRSVNVKKKHFDLYVMTQKLNIQHVNLYEPVWITLSGSSPRVEFMATRIDKDRVQGYISQFMQPKSELTVSHVRRRGSGGL
jgi:hypothetical protein